MSSVSSSTMEGEARRPQPYGGRKTFCSSLTLEPMMLFHMIGLTSQMVILQNFYLERICRNVHHFPEEICANLTKYAGPEKMVEATATEYSTYRGLIEGGSAVFFAIFVGPWSDKYGTKLPILLSMFGFLFSSGFYFFFSFYPDAPPRALLLCSIPIALTGSMTTIVICVFSFIASNSNQKNRSFRIAMVEGAWWLGSPVGLILGAEINNKLGTSWVMGMTTMCYFIALVLGHFYIHEDPQSKSPMPKDGNEFCSELFNLAAVKELFVTCFREREGNRRRWIMLLVATLNLRLLSLVGIWNILFLYTRNMFGWDFFQYSKFAAVDAIIGVVGMYLMIFITLKWLKLKDPIIGVIAGFSFLLATAIMAGSQASWMVYLASVVQMPSAMMSTVTRSLLSKCVSKRELGKIYSFLATGEAVMPLIAAPLYNLVYSKTISTFPGTAFLISLGFSLFMTATFLYLAYSMRNFEAPLEMEVNFRNAEVTDPGTYSSTDSESEDDDGINIEVRGSRFDKIEIFSLTS